MKKLLVLSTLTVVISIGFSSCRKCEICTKESEPEIRVCEGDYATNTEYGLALDVLEATGYKCR